jgi:hypothetical protein
MTKQAYYKKTPKNFRGILYKVKFLIEITLLITF